jgi:hypothetical protein
LMPKSLRTELRVNRAMGDQDAGICRIGLQR